MPSTSRLNVELTMPPFDMAIREGRHDQKNLEIIFTQIKRCHKQQGNGKYKSSNKRRIVSSCEKVSAKINLRSDRLVEKT